MSFCIHAVNRSWTLLGAFLLLLQVELVRKWKGKFVCGLFNDTLKTNSV